MKRKLSMRQAYAERIRREGLPKAKARKPLRKVSSARRIAQKVYSEKRRLFLIEHPDCQAHALIWPGEAVPLATDVHHCAGRTGKNYLDVSTWLALCRSCHEWTHQHPNQARALGLLK